MSAVLAIARADFLERVRRYSFLFTLGFALYLGYLATAGNLVLQVGNMRGIFNSAWVGALLALVGTDFISLAGFYFVNNTIERDRETRVGQILAATPISKFMYAFGKMLSNLAVLSLMLAVLAAAGIAMQLVSGEDRHIELWKLVAPFVLLAFPAMAVTAAVAVFFETVPLLRGGFGNVAYFFLWTAGLSIPLATGKHAFDLMGLSMVADSARAAAHLSQRNGGVTFSLSFGQIAKPVSLFQWDGLAWTADIIALRLMWLAFAVAIVAVSALLFDRFDPSRGKALREAADTRSAGAPGVLQEQNVPAAHATAANLTLLGPGKHKTGSSRFWRPSFG